MLALKHHLHEFRADSNIAKTYLLKVLQSITIPMLDHLISELDTRFDESSSLYIMEFMQLLPSEVIKNAPSQQQFLHIISLYEDDLLFSRAFGTELDLWVSKWKDSEPSLARELDTPVKVMRLIDRDYYPNILKS